MPGRKPKCRCGGCAYCKHLVANRRLYIRQGRMTNAVATAARSAEPTDEELDRRALAALEREQGQGHA